MTPFQNLFGRAWKLNIFQDRSFLNNPSISKPLLPPFFQTNSKVTLEWALDGSRKSKCQERRYGFQNGTRKADKCGKFPTIIVQHIFIHFDRVTLPVAWEYVAGIQIPAGDTFTRLSFINSSINELPRIWKKKATFI